MLIIKNFLLLNKLRKLLKLKSFTLFIIYFFDNFLYILKKYQVSVKNKKQILILSRLLNTN